MKHTCPLCNGSGKIEMILKPKPADNAAAAKKLKKEGYTIRQIMKALGYKHPGSVSHLLK